ncbi:hypothetical protein E2C01_053420 [Portunus trituberculatus]|uniref:Uncharacterized protein n=1 Tax=Portunus trituberculatus TaxID=210409 RepID=A0A5B7GH26_PORTR|nr:hypothetical protein [Portunus trituberculatus]
MYLNFWDEGKKKSKQISESEKRENWRKLLSNKSRTAHRSWTK